jgi:glycerophosphoryl diester phosphodiesterase
MGMQDAEFNSPAAKLIASKKPLIIGHRGYCELAPENTIPSFKLAIDAGADLVELDYHHTKDGQPIVIHDATLDRTTDAVRRWRKRRIKVDSKTASEIQSLDAGSWFNRKYAGTKIPLLSEVLDVIQQNSVTLIERKSGDPAACIRLLREKDLINKVVVQSFDWNFLREFHEQEPRQVLGALGPPAVLPDGKKPPRRTKALSAAWLDDLHLTGAKVAAWNSQLSKEAVNLANERGLKVWVYTISKPTVANRLLDIGVRGLITNNPFLIHNLVELRHFCLQTS